MWGSGGQLGGGLAAPGRLNGTIDARCGAVTTRVLGGLD